MPNILSPARKISDMMKQEKADTIERGVRNLRKRRTNASSSKEPQIKLQKIDQPNNIKESKPRGAKRRSAPVKNYKEISDVDAEASDGTASDNGTGNRNRKVRSSSSKPQAKKRLSRKSEIVDHPTKSNTTRKTTVSNKGCSTQQTKNTPGKRQRKSQQEQDRSSLLPSPKKSNPANQVTQKPEVLESHSSDIKSELSAQPSTSCADAEEHMSSTDDDDDWEEVEGKYYTILGLPFDTRG